LFLVFTGRQFPLADTLLRGRALRVVGNGFDGEFQTKAVRVSEGETVSLAVETSAVKCRATVEVADASQGTLCYALCLGIVMLTACTNHTGCVWVTNYVGVGLGESVWV
jgi:hypothetical protein